MGRNKVKYQTSSNIYIERAKTPEDKIKESQEPSALVFQN